MAVDDGLNVRSCLVDLAVDKALDETGAAIRVDRIAVQIVLDDVIGHNQRRRDRARHQITVGCRRMPQRDVPEAIDDSLHREYAASRGKIRDEIGSEWAAGFIRHGFPSGFYMP